MARLPQVLQGWQVLVVDDEFDSRWVAAIMLEDVGANVTQAEDGRDALDKISASLPQFILCDLSMPNMDGWGVLRELRQFSATAHIPVIALTAHAMIGDRDRAIAAGFNQYITKPIDPDKFIGQVIAILSEIPEFKERLSATQEK